MPNYEELWSIAKLLIKKDYSIENILKCNWEITENEIATCMISKQVFLLFYIYYYLSKNSQIIRESSLPSLAVKPNIHLNALQLYFKFQCHVWSTLYMQNTEVIIMWRSTLSLKSSFRSLIVVMYFIIFWLLLNFSTIIATKMWNLVIHH